MEPVLALRGVDVGYPGAPAIARGVDLSVASGEVVALVGPSGTGKTTLLRTALGAVRPVAGAVNILGHKWPARPPRGAVGYIPQRLGLVQHATALDNVVMGGLHREPSLRNLVGLPSPHLRREAHAVLGAVGLGEKADTPVKRLSGGQQRRTAIARALLQRPRLLIADEFLGELDAETAAVVQEAVLRLAETEGTGILLVEHRRATAHAMADRVLEFAQGRIQDITDVARATGPVVAATGPRLEVA